jgi:hypothetical protein
MLYRLATHTVPDDIIMRQVPGDSELLAKGYAACRATP